MSELAAVAPGFTGAAALQQRLSRELKALPFQSSGDFSGIHQTLDDIEQQVGQYARSDDNEDPAAGAAVQVVFYTMDVRDILNAAGIEPPGGAPPPPPPRSGGGPPARPQTPSSRPPTIGLPSQQPQLGEYLRDPGDNWSSRQHSDQRARNLKKRKDAVAAARAAEPARSGKAQSADEWRAEMNRKHGTQLGGPSGIGFGGQGGMSGYDEPR